MNARTSKDGFSLVEVMVALLVLGVALVGLAQGLTTALRSTKESEWQTAAVFLAAGQIELLRADGYLKAGVTEGNGSAGLSNYQWKEIVSTTPVEGLFEVSVEVRRDPDTSLLFALNTLLFDPPLVSRTNRPTSRPDSASTLASRRSFP